MICAIVAVDQNWGIGYKGNLLCHLKDDLKRFKQITEDNIVVMGMTTYESLPKKPLSNRTNIVITHQYTTPYKDKHYSVDYITLYSKTLKVQVAIRFPL